MICQAYNHTNTSTTFSYLPPFVISSHDVHSLCLAYILYRQKRKKKIRTKNIMTNVSPQVIANDFFSFFLDSYEFLYIWCNSVYCVTRSRESFSPGEKERTKPYTIWSFWFIIQLIYCYKKNHSISLLISLQSFTIPHGNGTQNCFHLFMTQ